MARAAVVVVERLRRETNLTIRQIAERLHLGNWKSAATRLQHLKRNGKQHEIKPWLWFEPFLME